MRERAARLINLTFPYAWGLLVVLLPFSSLPLVSRLARSDSVAAASALPLLWLVALWFIPFVLSGGCLPRTTLPVLALASVALIASAGAFFLGIPPFKGVSILSREGQSFTTLAVGLAFYLVISTWPVNPRRLRLTLQLVNWSGLVVLVWSLAQGYFWFRFQSVPDWMWRIQESIDLNGFFYQRVNGFAYEPSWFAHQLNMVYLPLWLAATLRRTTVHRYRLLGVTLENLLLVMGIGALLLSFSRVGWLALLLVVAYLLIAGILTLARRIQRVALARWTLFDLQKGVTSVALSAILLAALFAGLSFTVLRGVRLASRYDPRLANLFNADLLSRPDPYNIANKLAFAERVVFWGTGWEIFGDHPLLGVGLGNAGFYFPAKMPGLGWSLTEVNTVIFRAAAIPNTKSLWTRLLSETGILGLAIFLAWLYLMWQAGKYLRHRRDTLLQTIGLAGAFVVVALIAEGFSVDSFALPYLWFSMGLVTAAGQLALASPDLVDGARGGI